MKLFCKLRCFALLAAFASALTSFSHAILDINNNGMSDLWEKKYNNGNLYPANFVANEDPDQDGWNNGTEAIAGTDPFLASGPTGIVNTIISGTQTAGAYTLTWPATNGKRYRLQASYDLDTWFSVGNSITTTEPFHTLGVSAEVPNSPALPKIFWRIIIGDLDHDNDGLTNVEEFQLNTNALSVDTDSDGLSDYEEIVKGTNPNQADTDGDGAKDSLEEIEGTDPGNGSSHPPLFYSETKGLYYIFSNLASQQHLDDPPSPSGTMDKFYSWSDEEHQPAEITEKINLLDLVSELPTESFPGSPQESTGSLNVSSAFSGSSVAITDLGEDQPTEYYATGRIDHTHVWFKRTEAHSAPIAVKLLLTKSRRYFDGNVLTSKLENEFKTLTIPANGTVSNTLELEPTLEEEPSEVGNHFEHYDIIPMPILVKDGGRIIHSLPFNQDPWANSSIQSHVAPSCIAWIQGNTLISNNPEMPNLSVELGNGRTDIMVSWRFECEYRRGNGYRKSYISDFSQDTDVVKIPANGQYTAPQEGNITWNIFAEPAWVQEINNKGFFGGLAKIYMKVGNDAEVEVSRFRIGGRNPNQSVARAYIDELAGEEFWYAYAIAKHETFGRVRDNGVARYYNQFYSTFKPEKIGDQANDMGWACWAHGWPVYNLDRSYSSKTGYKQNGPGGYGIYQLTLGPKKVDGDQTYQSFVTRDEIWNWQANCRRAIGELREKKSKFAIPLVNALEAAHPTWPSLLNTKYQNFNGLEAATITYYNGMYGAKLEVHAQRRSCWRPDRKANIKSWRFLPNANDYVNKVKSKLE